MSIEKHGQIMVNGSVTGQAVALEEKGSEVSTRPRNALTRNAA
ncbi:hypothetical protein ACTOVN_00205 [Arcanobacterium canis]